MKRGRRITRRETLATADELWGAHPPKQVRSVDAIQRIAAAARSLFRQREYDAVSVADLAATAGMSVGAVYTRFPSKEHLVVHLMGDLATELRAVMQREMNPADLVACDVAEVVRRYLHMMANAFVAYRGLLRPASLIARQTNDKSLQALLRRFNDEVHGKFRALLLEKIGNDSPALTIARIDTAILWSSAAIREVLLYGEPVSSLATHHPRLIEELTRGIRLYLKADGDE